MALLWNQQQRRHTRYEVSWRALLEVDTPDFNDFMPVPMVNVSRSGALIRPPRIFMHNYHLSVAAQHHELNLIIQSPGCELDSKVMVRRYAFNEKEQAYDVGLEFRDLCQKNQRFIADMIKSISQENGDDLTQDQGPFDYYGNFA